MKRFVEELCKLISKEVNNRRKTAARFEARIDMGRDEWLRETAKELGDKWDEKESSSEDESLESL